MSTHATSASKPAADISLHKTLVSFHLFPDLPIEIRLAIWKLLEEPRLVCVELCAQQACLCELDSLNLDTTLPNREHDEYGHWHENARCYGFRCRTPVPQHLFTCRDSLYATNGYQKLFGSKYTYPETWFNPDIDTLFIRGWSGLKRLVDTLPLKLLAPQDLQQIKKLVIPTDYDVGHIRQVRSQTGAPDLYTQLSKILPNFPHVECLYFVDSQGDGVSKWNGRVELFDIISFKTYWRYNGFISGRENEPSCAIVFHDTLDRSDDFDVDEAVLNLPEYVASQLKLGALAPLSVKEFRLGKKMIGATEKMILDYVIKKFEKKHGYTILE